MQIDMLEHQLRQQQPADGHISSSEEQPQQVEQQLRQQLATTQQQFARLQEEHMQYVDRTSSLLVRLQVQMQQLMKQAPGLAGGIGEEAHYK
jgi:DNA-binding transcriptional MerR regulator